MNIKTIKIKNSYFDNIEIYYNNKTNIFVGPNGIGKTYIYDIIQSIVNTYTNNSNNNNSNNNNDNVLKNSEIELKIVINNTDELHKSLCEYINTLYYLYNNDHNIKINNYNENITIKYIYTNGNIHTNKKIMINIKDCNDIYYDINYNNNNDYYELSNKIMGIDSDLNYKIFINDEQQIKNKIKDYVESIHYNNNKIINYFINKNDVNRFGNIIDVLRNYITNYIKNNITFISSNKNNTLYDLYIFNNNDKLNKIKAIFKNIFNCDFKFQIDLDKLQFYYKMMGIIETKNSLGYLHDLMHNNDFKKEMMLLKEYIDNDENKFKNYIYIEVYNKMTKEYNKPSDAQSEIIELLYNIYINKSNIIIIDEPCLYSTPQTIKKFFKYMTDRNKQIILNSNKPNIINIDTLDDIYQLLNIDNKITINKIMKNFIDIKDINYKYDYLSNILNESKDEISNDLLDKLNIIRNSHNNKNINILYDDISDLYNNLYKYDELPKNIYELIEKIKELYKNKKVQQYYKYLLIDNKDMFFNNKNIIVEGISDKCILLAFNMWLRDFTNYDININIVNVNGKKSIIPFNNFISNNIISNKLLIDNDFIYDNSDKPTNLKEIQKLYDNVYEVNYKKYHIMEQIQKDTNNNILIWDYRDINKIYENYKDRYSKYGYNQKGNPKYKYKDDIDIEYFLFRFVDNFINKEDFNKKSISIYELYTYIKYKMYKIGIKYKDNKFIFDKYKEEYDNIININCLDDYEEFKKNIIALAKFIMNWNNKIIIQ
jgi:hypothetical protein